MIIKGKNKSEIARQIGISKQAMQRRIQKFPESLSIDEDGMLCYDTELRMPHKKLGRHPSRINYNPDYKGEYITRNEYVKKYNITYAYVIRLINKKKLFTSEDGKFVADILYKNI